MRFKFLNMRKQIRKMHTVKVPNFTREYIQHFMLITSLDDKQRQLNVLDIIPASTDPVFYDVHKIETDYSF